MRWTKLLQHHHLFEPENVMFALAVKFQHLHPELLEWAIGQVENPDKLGTLLTDVEDGKIQLKQDLDEASYQVFINHLKTYGMTAEGHRANKLKYPLGIASRSAAFEFDRFLMEYESVDLKKLAKKVAAFYEKGEYLPKFPKFIRENLAMLV